MIPKDVKIEIFTKDDGPEKDCDNMYCAIVLGLSPNDGWYNTGIVVRCETATEAFIKAKNLAILEGWWY